MRPREEVLIHSHSRRAHWVAAQAAALARIPHVATVHQPLPVHLFSRIFPCLGDHTIAIDEAIHDHLRKHFARGIRRLSLVRNGIDLSHGNALVGSLPSENRLLVLGRLTGGRWRALLFFFNVLKRTAATLQPTRFEVVGRIPPERAEDLRLQVEDVNRTIHPSSVETHDFVEDLSPLLARCRGVIAGGRSALEGMAAGRPVIALGERGVVGLCNVETWPEAMRTNFGDHFDTAADHFYPVKLEWGLRQLTGKDPRMSELGRWGRAQLEKHYNIQTIAPEIEKIYEGLRR